MTTITATTADLLHTLRVGSTTARHSPSTTPEALTVHIEALTGSLVRISSQVGPEFSRCYAPARIDVDGPTHAAVDVLDAAGLIKSLSDPHLPSQVRLHITAGRVHLEINKPGPTTVRLRMVTNRADALPAPPAPAPAPLSGAVPRRPCPDCPPASWPTSSTTAPPASPSSSTASPTPPSCSPGPSPASPTAAPAWTSTPS